VAEINAIELESDIAFSFTIVPVEFSGFSITTGEATETELDIETRVGGNNAIFNDF
jgi:hypothetical protein